MPRLFRFACFAVLALSVGIPEITAACVLEPPPEPPPRTPSESAAEFTARSGKWYGDLYERQRKEALPGEVADENRLWATAQRVVLARIEKVGSIRLRGSEGQYYKSPLVTLRAVKWLKGNASPRHLKVHYLSDDSCKFGGAGDAPRGDSRDLILLFYRPGPLDARNVLDTFSKDRVVTTRSRDAFGLQGGR